MLPRSQRLGILQFNAIMAKGRITHSAFFLLRSLKVPESPARIAAVVPQKIVKKATGRNKLRRRMYEAVQPLYLSIQPGIHGILFAKSTAVELEFSDLSKEVKEIFVKAAILK